MRPCLVAFDRVRPTFSARRPNGLAFDPGRRTLLVANFGDPDYPTSHTLSIADTDRAVMSGSIPVAGRTHRAVTMRWRADDSASDEHLIRRQD
jgi:hypothetical protein